MKAKIIICTVIMTLLVILFILWKTPAVYESYSILLNYRADIEGMPVEPFYEAVYIDNYIVSKKENYIYYTLENFNGNTAVYTYDTEKKHSEVLTEIKKEDAPWGITGITISKNRKKILLISKETIICVDTYTGIYTKIMDISKKNDSLCVYGDSIYFVDENDNLIIKSISDGTEKILDEIKTALFVIYDDTLYFADSDNNGGLSTYNLKTHELIRNDTSIVMGFELRYGKIEAQYAEV